MPRTFRDLEEARSYWELISGRVLHFICECSAISAPYDDNEKNQWKLGADLPMAVNAGGNFEKVQQLDCYRSEKKRYLDEISRWSSAFGDHYSKFKRTFNRRLIMGAHSLYVKTKSMEIGVGTALDRSVCSHDKYFTHFREIITLSRDTIQMKKFFSQAEFSIELGIIPSLHMTAKWRRERATCMEAIRLLYWYGSREGHWDSKAMADITSCVMRLEEEGSDTEYIPECARVTVISINTEEEGWATINFIRDSPRMGEFLEQKGLDDQERCMM
jgi:hypothetical protein